MGFFLFPQSPHFFFEDNLYPRLVRAEYQRVKVDIAIFLQIFGARVIHHQIDITLSSDTIIYMTCICLLLNLEKLTSFEHIVIKSFFKNMIMPFWCPCFCRSTLFKITHYFEIEVISKCPNKRSINEALTFFN